MDMLWLIVAFALMAILPDLLRRRRRYPRRKGPIPVPPRRKPAPAKAPAPAETVEEAAGNEISAPRPACGLEPADAAGAGALRRLRLVGDMAGTAGLPPAIN